MPKVATRGAVQQVVAGKEAQLELRIKGSHPDGTACQFQIYKAADQSLLDTLDGQVKKGKATTRWTAKGPDESGPDRAHRVYYVVTVADKEKTTSPELEVYHDWVEVTSKNEDGAALADVRFVLTVKSGGFDKKFPGNTGSTGTFKVDNLPPGEVDVTWASPARLVEWTEATATKRTAKLKKSFRATLLWPKAGTHKQWVNHKAKPGQPDWGSKLKVRVGVHPDDGPSKKGDEVFIKLEYPPADQLSKRAKPARGAKGATAAPWCAPMLGLTKKIERDGGEVEVEVELGLAGGDKVTIHVGGTEACDDEKVEVTNWRRIYYQVTRPSTSNAHDTRRAEERLEPCFVVLERFNEVIIDPGQAPPEVRASWIPGRELDVPDQGRDYLIVGDHNERWFRRHFDPSKGKLAVHVILCDGQFDAGESKKKRVTSTFVATLTTPEAVLELDDDKWVFPRALTTGEHPLLSGTWEALDLPKGQKRKGTLTKDHVIIDKASARFRLVLPRATRDDPGSFVGDGTNGTSRVRCKLKLLAAYGPYNGSSDGAHVLVVDGPNGDIFNDIVLHELGHSMKLAPSRGENEPPKGLSLADHPHAYEGRDHEGEHCNYGLDQAGATHLLTHDPDGSVVFVPLEGPASEAPSYSGLCKQVGTAYVSVHGTCIMYGSSPGVSSPGPPVATAGFCEHCRTFLKAQSLEDLT